MPNYKQLLNQVNELIVEKEKILQTLPSLEEFPKIEEDEELDRKVKRLVKRLIEINEELEKLTKQLTTVFEHEETYYTVEIKEDASCDRDARQLVSR